MNKAELERTALSEQAYKSLRTAILTGSIPFGTQLVVKDLAELIGFSPTPVKQALTSLEREGLVLLIPFRGFFVPSFDARDVIEIYEVREALERRAARTAIRHMTGSAFKQLETILLAQVKSAREGNTETHVDLDLQFHTLIAELSQNQRLLDQAHSILGQAQLIIASSALSQHRFKEIHAEHQSILTALRSENANKAELAVWQHLQNARASLQKHYKDMGTNEFTSDRLQLDSELQALSQSNALNSVETRIPLIDVLSDKEKNFLRDSLAEFIGPMAIFATAEVLRKRFALKDAIKDLALRIPNELDAKAFLETVQHSR